MNYTNNDLLYRQTFPYFIIKLDESYIFIYLKVVYYEQNISRESINKIKLKCLYYITITSVFLVITN